MGGEAKVGARPPLEILPKKIMCAVLFSSYGDFFHVEGLGEGFFFLLGVIFSIWRPFSLMWITFQDCLCLDKILRAPMLSLLDT